MKFLVDHQLPPALAEFLCRLGHESRHVRDVGLKSDDDWTIWEFATENDFALISKDQDFFDLANRAEKTGKLIWVRLGNCRNQPLFQIFETYLPRILESFANGNHIVELR